MLNAQLNQRMLKGYQRRKGNCCEQVACNFYLVQGLLFFEKHIQLSVCQLLVRKVHGCYLRLEWSYLKLAGRGCLLRRGDFVESCLKREIAEVMHIVGRSAHMQVGWSSFSFTHCTCARSNRSFKSTIKRRSNCTSHACLQNHLGQTIGCLGQKQELGLAFCQ